MNITFIFEFVTFLLAIGQLVRRLKQESILQLGFLHGTSSPQTKWDQRLLGSDSFLVCSRGKACPETIRQGFHLQA